MAHEQLEQGELGARELEPPLAAVHLVGDRVERQVIEGERARTIVVVASAPAQQRAHARHQLAQRERLDEVVVGAGVEAGDAVVDRVARGQHQDRAAVAARRAGAGRPRARRARAS